MTSADHQSAAGAPTAANGLDYRTAGVDIEAGDALVEAIKPLARATSRTGVMGGLGGFGALFDLKAAGFIDPVLVSTTDGVGTKLKIAIETGLHDTVGVDLVAMCVNDLVVQGAEPLFFLDYFATGKLSVEQARAVIAGIASGCHEAGCALVGGETAEMPGMYADGDYDLAGFSVGAAERGNLLPRPVSVGDQVLGLASAGFIPTASRWCAGSCRPAAWAGPMRRRSPRNRRWGRLS